nr:hypothetical protein [Candidatus Sigynarchaeota archaeon]
FKGDPGNHDRVFDALLGMNALPRGVLNVLAAPTGTPLLDIGKLDTLHLSDGEMLPPDAWRASIEALIADAKVPGMTGVIDVNGFLAQHGNVKEWPTTTTEPSEVAHAEIPPATIAVMHGSEPIMIIDGDHVTLAIPIDDVPYPALASPRACIIACKARVRNLPRDIDVIAYVIRRGKKGKPPALMQHVKTAVGTYFDRAFDAYMRQHVLAAPVDQVAWDTAMAAAGRAVHAIAAITGDASLPGRARRVARDAAIDCSANLSPKITLSGAETSDAGGALIGLDALGPPIYYPPVTKQGLLARLRQRMKHG